MMIRSIKIENFRCFQNLSLSEVGRFNIVAGDNGSGKTALLEAIFLALSKSPEIGIRYRQQRGFSWELSGPVRHIEQALWRDFFFERDWNRTITVSLMSKDEVEERSVKLFRKAQQRSIPLTSHDIETDEITAPITMQWHDSKGKRHELTPLIKGNRIELPDTGEDIVEHFYFSSSPVTPATEVATKFSELSKDGLEASAVCAIKKVFPWISDFSIEYDAGSAILFASVEGKKGKLPLPVVSGGVNRIVGVVMSVATARNSVVLIDEIENGIYYKAMPEIARALVELAEFNESQIICTTHSYEWIEGMIGGFGNSFDDVQLWRAMRDGGEHTVEQIAGSKIAAAIQYDTEVR